MNDGHGTGLRTPRGDAATDVTPRPWRDAETMGAIVSDDPDAIARRGADNRHGYGGAVVCESAEKPDRDFIIRAANEYDALVALERVARTMVSILPATAPLSLLLDVARFLDEVDAQRGIEGETEMQDSLRDWDTDISDALARLDSIRGTR